jgi:hypothetical protein
MARRPTRPRDAGRWTVSHRIHPDMDVIVLERICLELQADLLAAVRLENAAAEFETSTRTAHVVAASYLRLRAKMLRALVTKVRPAIDRCIEHPKPEEP